MKGTNASYFGSILEGVSSSWKGLKLTLKHFWQARFHRTPVGIADDNYFAQKTGIVTLQYPMESIPVPDNGRYRLYNEIDDCIVCDLCAKICPVNCIEIEPIKATEEIGKTSDGTTKRIYAAKFDIDMAKCCYCGLCTTVCPTECLTMTKSYDYSEFDVRNMVYHFTDLSPAESEDKKQLLEDQKAAKAIAALPKSPEHPAKEEIQAADKKPAFKPVIKAPAPINTGDAKETENTETLPEKAPAAKPIFILIIT